MSRQIWGCYAVADHKLSRAFVADVLLFERLVVPVPPEDDPAELTRWQTRNWAPERQERLLGILGSVAYQVPWTAQRQEQWERGWAARAADDVAFSASEAQAASVTGVSPQAAHVTRQVITEAVTEKVFGQRDVIALAVYGSPVKFDQDWQVTRSLPFLRRHTSAQPVGRYEVEAPAVGPEEYRLSRLLVAELAVPEEEGVDDEEMLRRAIGLAGHKRVADWRASFHAWVADMAGRSLSDETVVREMGELIDEYNAAVRQSKIMSAFRTAAALIGPIGAAGGLIWEGLRHAAEAEPIVGAGQLIADRIWGEAAADRIKAATLLAEARRELH